MLALMRRFIDRQGDDTFFIKSAFTTPGSKGYVYVEADKEIHAVKVLHSFFFFVSPAWSEEDFLLSTTGCRGSAALEGVQNRTRSHQGDGPGPFFPPP